MTLALTGAGLGSPGGGAPFTPASLPGLMAWYDLSTQAGADGSAISSVADLSGNGRTLSQATGANQPLVQAAGNGINGLKVAKFDGSLSFMLSPSFASPTAGVSVFAVIQFRVAPTTNQHIVVHAGAATWVSPFGRYALRSTPGGKLEGWVEDAGVGANVLASTISAVTTAEVRGFVYDQSAMTHFNDGVADGTVARSGLLTSTTQPLFVGNHQGGVGAGEWLDGKLGEIVVCDNGISAGNIASLSTYFRSKWATP